jgi:glycerophosphoryl diester phosphodiesterase
MSIPSYVRQASPSFCLKLVVICNTLIFAVALSIVGSKHSQCQEPISPTEVGLAVAAVKEIIAHRGSSADRPENTMSSAIRAIEAGATAIEIDLRTTLDGHLVILHDSSVARTTDGDGNVGDLTLQQIQKLDAGSKFGKLYSGEKIATFEEMLQVAKTSKVCLLLDLKESGSKYAQKIAGLIRQYGISEKIIVGVRSEEQAKEFRKELPDCVQLGFIPTPDRIESFRAAGVDMIRLWSNWLSEKSIVERVRKSGAKLQINVGRGGLEEVEPILRYRPDAILCDDPALLIKSLDTLRSKSTVNP